MAFKYLFVSPVFINLNRHLFNLSTRMMSSKKAIVLLTDGVEEMEAVITADVLRRAQIDVTLATLDDGNHVKCSRNVMIVPDAKLNDVSSDAFDCLILPGGMNAAKTFANSDQVGKLLKNFESSGKLIGVICASPIALQKHEIGVSKRITSHPSVKDQLTNYKYVEDRVAVDDKLITSRGPGTAFEFALSIVAQLISEDKSKEISAPMIL